MAARRAILAILTLAIAAAGAHAEGRRHRRGDGGARSHPVARLERCFVMSRKLVPEGGMSAVARRNLEAEMRRQSMCQ